MDTTTKTITRMFIVGHTMKLATPTTDNIPAIYHRPPLGCHFATRWMDIYRRRTANRMHNRHDNRIRTITGTYKTNGRLSLKSTPNKEPSVFWKAYNKDTMTITSGTGE